MEGSSDKQATFGLARATNKRLLGLARATNKRLLGLARASPKVAFTSHIKLLLLPEVVGQSRPKTRLTLSEIMTILIGFHGSRYRTFKDFYRLQVMP